ncbi:receptor-type tyrosine-protein phosphatase R-like [Hydractinia symbiolongicarpus]|uniref:receptor-type tyrosine-protein phosphatase R-like n=1 Tax=Hydractinia symbiolongicarpus TaxID=13093 RepID=UPI0025506B2B|nr:receptor-type tyrosine-protein phosphatase R-like [Hydractinia symbiolongicarpus]
MYCAKGMICAALNFLATLCLSIHAGPIGISEANTDQNMYERVVFRELLKDAVLRELVKNHIKHSETQKYHNTKHEVKKSVEPTQSTLSNNNVKHVLVMTLAVPLEHFLLLEPEFLQDIENHIKYKGVRCLISEASESAVSTVLLDLYCLYHIPAKLSKVSSSLYVPTHKLERLMTSGNMRGFLQKYNVTKFYSKVNEARILSMSSLPFTHNTWLPIVLAICGIVLLVIICVFIVMCMKKKNIEEGEIPSGSSLRDTRRHSSLAISPIKSRNSFSVSPKKFLYAPQKNSTPIFSFTSPTKYKDKVVYPLNSPIETTPPCYVQPPVDLLFPVGSSVRGSSRGSTGNSSSDKSRTLLQSRRGSSASLIIDLSPVTPVYDFIAHESPTEEILLRKSRCIRYRELQMLKDNDKELHEEFWSIPPNTVSRKDSNMKSSLKNRYPEIVPNSKTMVRLKDADESPVYINANYIKGYNGVPNQYIATQGPLTCTLADFWLMIWQYNCSIIVMITKLKEKNKDKCMQYWPSPDTVTQITYGDVVVTYDSEMNRDGYKILTLYASHKGSEECRKVTHFWFTGWPDHKVPKHCTQVVNLTRDVRQIQSTQSGPVVIHCSAGRGRTGCFIALSLGMSQIDEENEVDILKIVSRMRIDRGGMVDKDHQYIFIHKALYHYWTSKRCSSSSSPSLSRSSLEHAEEMRESEDSLVDSLEGDAEFKGFSFGN